MVPKKRRGRPKKVVRPPGRRGRMLGEKPTKKADNFRRGIYKIVTRYRPELTIKKSTMEILNSVVMDMMRKLQIESCQLLSDSKRKVFDATTVDAATRIVFPGSCAACYSTDARAAVNKWSLNIGRKKKF